MPITIRVKDRMSKDIKSIESSSSILDAVKFMNSENIGAILVNENGTHIGVLTERDIIRAVSENGSTNKLVKEFMSKPPIKISQDANIGRATQMMITKNIRRLFVEDENNNIVGFIDIKQLMRTVHSSFLALFDI